MVNRYSVYGQIPLEELASLPSYYIPTLSHDRKRIAFYGDKTGRMELYVMDTASGATPHQVSHGEVPKSLKASFCWTRDNRYIIFPKDNDGDEQHNLWWIKIETGEAEQLTENPHCQEYPVEVSPDNRTLLVNSNLNGQMNLFAFDLETHQYQQLTHYANPAVDPKWSPDGQQIAFVVNETEDLKNSDIYLMNRDGSQPRRILQMAVGSQDGISDWSADGRYLAVSSDYSGGNRAGVYDLTQDELRWFTPEDKTVYSGQFSPDSKRLLVSNNVDAAITTAVYAVESGEEQQVELPPGLNFNAAWMDNDRFMVNIMTDVRRSELRDYRMADGASDVLLEAEYGSIDPNLFTRHEYISYTSSDGVEIHAIVYRPRHLEPGKKYPALVEIHGGPTGQFFRGFDAYAQFLADNDYIIIQPNPRGSSGYGVEFRDMALKDWGGGDLEDIEAAAEYLKQLPEVDSERIGAWGGSYGGYLTFMAMTKKPHIWKAGVAWVGITDLKKLYDSSMEHFKYYLREQMGDPDENAELWYDRSAINFMQQMSGHLLIAHGTNDPRCPIEQARIARDRLQELGKIEGQDFEYVEFGDEGHGSNDIQHKLRTYNILVDYFQRRL